MKPTHYTRTSMMAKTAKTAMMTAAIWLALVSAAMSQTRGTGALDTARRLLDAFNRHDPAGMAAVVDERFELYYVGVDGVSAIAARGPKELEAQMVEYFKTRPTVRSEIEASIDGPRFVAFRERPVTRPGAPEPRPSSLAVYEVVDGKILRAWYFPAEPASTQPPATPRHQSR